MIKTLSRIILCVIELNPEKLNDLPRWPSWLVAESSVKALNHCCFRGRSFSLHYSWLLSFRRLSVCAMVIIRGISRTKTNGFCLLGLLSFSYYWKSHKLEYWTRKTELFFLSTIILNKLREAFTIFFLVWVEQKFFFQE